MIKNAAEFLALSLSNDPEERHRATHDAADIDVWLEIMEKYPELKSFVIGNKTIQVEVLEVLCIDKDPNFRSEVARKRKINDKVFNALANDPDEHVRYALMCNTKLTIDQKHNIKRDDSPWLIKQFEDIVKDVDREH